MVDINTVIVNWKMKDDIKRCLKTFFIDLEGSGLEAVVHVVDNSQNQDGIKQMLKEKYPQVRYIDPGMNLGFGKAQNIGFEKQRADFYLSLNPDCEFIEGERTLKRMTEFLKKNPKVGMLGPKLLNSDQTLQYSCYRFPGFWDQIIRRLGWDKKTPYLQRRVDHYLMKDFDHNSNARVDWLMGSFILVRKETSDTIGFFDDRFFMYFEDCDWCRRAWRSGWQVYYIHDTKVVHGHRRDSAEEKILRSIFFNPVTRIHLKSWLKYFWKWGLGRDRYGI